MWFHSGSQGFVNKKKKEKIKKRDREREKKREKRRHKSYLILGFTVQQGNDSPVIRHGILFYSKKVAGSILGLGSFCVEQRSALNFPPLYYICISVLCQYSYFSFSIECAYFCHQASTVWNEKMIKKDDRNSSYSISQAASFERASFNSQAGYCLTVWGPKSDCIVQNITIDLIC